MSVIMIDVKSRVPIYEQIITSVKTAVLCGYLKADEALPSVRALAAELVINPNTIQKAYSELERQGIVYSIPGRGNFVSSNTDELEKQHRSEILEALRENLKAAYAAGIDFDEIKMIAKKIKEEG